MRKGNRILSGLLALVMAAVMLLCPAAAISYEPDFTPGVPGEPGYRPNTV